APTLGEVTAVLIDDADLRAQVAPAFLFHLGELVAHQKHDLRQAGGEGAHGAHRGGGRGRGAASRGPHTRRLQSGSGVGHGVSTRTAGSASSLPGGARALFAPPGRGRVSLAFGPPRSSIARDFSPVSSAR